MKKTFFKRTVSTFLALIMVVSMCNGLHAEAKAADFGTVEVAAQGTYTQSSETQEIVIRITPDMTDKYCTFAVDGGMTIPDGFTIKSISTSNTAQPMNGGNYNLKVDEHGNKDPLYGAISYDTVDAEDTIPADTYYDVVLVAPADAVGDYSITLRKVQTASLWGSQVDIDIASVTATFTIEEAEAELITTISSVEDLIAFRNSVNSGDDYTGVTVTLAADLDLADLDWTPIGTDSYPFTGTFDGNGYVISNLTITNGNRYSGLFGKLDGATVEKLGMENINITSSNSDVGGLAGNAKGSTISQCYVTGSVEGSGGVGGILGSTHSATYPTTIENCYARVDLTGTGRTKDVAGISGWNGGTSVVITNCYSACTGEKRPIAGWSDGSSVSNSQFTSTYFDKTLSPDFSADAGRTDLGRTSDELKTQSTFVNWDFNTIWTIDTTGAINGGYPYLRMQSAPSSDASYTVVVTFKVVNGTWADDTDEDETVNVKLTNGKGTLNEEDVPVGMKANAGYENGAWDSEPVTTEDGITGAVTYTYTFTKIAHVCRENAEQVPGQAATCTEDGWNDYYECSCEKLYADADCTVEIKDLEAWKNGNGKIESDGHSYGAADFTWNGTTLTGTVTCDTCKEGTEGHELTDSAEGTVKSSTAGDCDTKATTTYEATVTLDGTSYTKETTIEGEYGEHSYGAADFTWNGTTLTGTVTCDTCKEGTEGHELTDSAEGTVKSSTAGDCDTKATTTYEATVTLDGTSYTKETTIEGEYGAHSYGAPEFTWNGTTLTGTVTCDTCKEGTEGHELTDSAEGTVKSSTAGDCDTKATTTYEATVTLDGTSYTKETTIEGEYGEHSYGAAEFTWNGTTLTGTVTCDTCKEGTEGHELTDSAEGTVKSSTAGDCDTKATTTYEATVTLDGTSYTKETTIEGEYGEHSYGAAEFTWNGTTLTGTVTCDTCKEGTEGHELTDSAEGTVKSSTAGDCDTKATTTYEATVTLDGTSYTKETTIEGEYGEHSYGAAEFTWNGTTLTGTVTCDTCKEGTEGHELTDSAEGTVKSSTAGDCDTKATTTYEATVTLDGTSYTKETTIEGEYGDHRYGAWTPDGASGHKHVCAINAEHVETKPHNYGDDRVCDTCGYRKHSYTPVNPSVPPVIDRPEAEDECRRDYNCPLYDYDDLSMYAWYHDGIHYCIENGLMRGIGNDSFGPNVATNRAMIVTILWRLEGNPVANYRMTFADVASGTWYTEAVRWAASEGIVEGYNEKSFGPNDLITREQMATIMWRYAKYKGYDVSVGEDTNILSYGDAFTVSEWAVPAMQWACGSGMIQGIAKGATMNLEPDGSATRAQVATMLYRFCEILVEEN